MLNVRRRLPLPSAAQPPNYFKTFKLFKNKTSNFQVVLLFSFQFSVVWDYQCWKHQWLKFCTLYKQHFFALWN
jgi:hypothetical protein